SVVQNRKATCKTIGVILSEMLFVAFFIRWDNSVICDLPFSLSPIIPEEPFFATFRVLRS
ncbi:MAG: hypothetical protein PHG65_12215, partial [Kiritimatiellae bacterium]|nr:hypothetical protein [Kiritimatiellia bacterium]